MPITDFAIIPETRGLNPAQGEHNTCSCEPKAAALAVTGIFAPLAGLDATKAESAAFWNMAQALHIDFAALKNAPTLSSVAEPVAVAPSAVAVAQPAAPPAPAWYRTPVVIVPIAAATFILGNVMLMIPWQVF